MLTDSNSMAVQLIIPCVLTAQLLAQLAAYNALSSFPSFPHSWVKVEIRKGKKVLVSELD
jgi:hypothetical protein